MAEYKAQELLGLDDDNDVNIIINYNNTKEKFIIKKSVLCEYNLFKVIIRGIDDFENENIEIETVSYGTTNGINPKCICEYILLADGKEKSDLTHKNIFVRPTKKQAMDAYYQYLKDWEKEFLKKFTFDELFAVLLLAAKYEITHLMNIISVAVYLYYRCK